MNRVLAFRFLEGETQETVGKRLGISTSMVSSIEKGTRRLSAPLLPLGYRNDRFDVPPMTDPLHRQRSTTRVSSTNRAKELLRLGGEVFAELMGMQPTGPSRGLEPFATPMTIEEIDDLAMDVRCGVLGHEATGPIRNLTRAVELSGVCLVPIAGLEGIDGLSSWVDGQAVIGLSVSVPGDRFRFSLAHEIGHLVMHDRKNEVTEHQANRFASSLLVPPKDLEVALPTSPTLSDFLDLKDVWGMSAAALIYKANQLDLIDDSRYRSLQIQMSRWKRVEPGEFAPALGRALLEMVESRGGVSTVAADLGVNVDHLRDVTTWSPLRSMRRLV
jgi:Zn-dependent peptidase ImmA (M78 family)/DNA-binding XRE family transcriptional regulator